MVEELCPTCGHYHEPDSEDSWVDYEGYRFSPPFKCMCCGKEICMRQFAFSRCCGSCDVGACQLGSMAYRPVAAHAQPAWRSGDRAEQIAKFAEATNAERIE